MRALTLATAHLQNNVKVVTHQEIKAYRLLIIDEIGYLPMNPQRANLFFQVIAQVYEKGSLIVTSNLPFRQWTRCSPGHDIDEGVSVLIR